MFLADKDIEITIYYHGPGRGCSQILKCKKLDFEKKIDSNNRERSIAETVEELQRFVFQAFRSGRFSFDSQEKQQRAEEIINSSDKELIDQIYLPDSFQREVIKYELEHRSLFDEEIFRIGYYGDETGKQQAIEMMKDKARD